MILRIPNEVYPENVAVLPTNNAVDFSIKIDGDRCVKYALKIYSRATSTLKKTYSTTLSSGNYVYDREYLHVSVNMTDVALGAGDYYWTIDLYWNDDSTSKITTYPYVFYAVANPTIAFSPAVPSTVTKQRYEFKGEYSQAQSKSIKRWQMILFDSAANKLKESPESTSSNIKYTFDGLMNAVRYGVQIVGITENDVEFSTAIQYFNVSYTVLNISSSFLPMEVREDGSVHLIYNSVTSILGKTTGTYSFEENFIFDGNWGLNLDEGSKVSFGVDITTQKFTYHKLFRPSSTSFTGVMGGLYNLETGDYVTVGYNGSRFYIDRNGNVEYDIPETLTTNIYIVAIYCNGEGLKQYHRDTGETGVV